MKNVRLLGMIGMVAMIAVFLSGCSTCGTATNECAVATCDPCESVVTTAYDATVYAPSAGSTISQGYAAPQAYTTSQGYVTSPSAPVAATRSSSSISAGDAAAYGIVQDPQGRTYIPYHRTTNKKYTGGLLGRGTGAHHGKTGL